MPSWLQPRASAIALVVVAVCAAAFGAASSLGSAGSLSAVSPSAIPLGDGHVSTSPRVGYVDSCTTSFGGGGGAMVDGPWIDLANHTWNETTKLAVSGSVRWPAARYAATTRASSRVLSFNDLPTDHGTGVFPIASSDPAYRYDRNPNRIAAQSVTWTLPLAPVAAAHPSCLSGGPIGVLDDGAYLYDALDGEGRDAAAHEVLDACAGHPDQSSSYHHHDVPPCILGPAPNGNATLVGYALDGYGIYVVKNANGTLPTNASLDACHGTTSVVPWNGRRVSVYHYVATLEYPYTVGCYHGTPLQTRRAGGPPPQGP